MCIHNAYYMEKDCARCCTPAPTCKGCGREFSAQTLRADINGVLWHMRCYDAANCTHKGTLMVGDVNGCWPHIFVHCSGCLTVWSRSTSPEAYV